MRKEWMRWLAACSLVLLSTAAFAGTDAVPVTAPDPASPQASEVVLEDLLSLPQVTWLSGSCTIRCLLMPSLSCSSSVGDCRVEPWTLWCDGAPYHCPCPPDATDCGSNPWT